MAPVPLVVPRMFQPKEAVVNQRFTYMLCEINLDRANFVIPLLFKLSNILAILLDTWTLTTNAIKRNFNWKKKTTTQKSTEKHDKRSDGIDHEMALISNFGALFDFWKWKKKMAGFFTLKNDATTRWRDVTDVVGFIRQRIWTFKKRQRNTRLARLPPTAAVSRLTSHVAPPPKSVTERRRRCARITFLRSMTDFRPHQTFSFWKKNSKFPAKIWKNLRQNLENSAVRRRNSQLPNNWKFEKKFEKKMSWKYSNLAPIRFKVETDIFLQIELRMCAAGWRCITDVLHENAAWTCHLHLIRWCLQGGGTGNQRHLLTSPTPSIDRHYRQRDDRSIELFVNEWNSGPCSSTSPWRDRCFDTRKAPKRFNSPGDSVNWHVQRATGLGTFWWILTITDGVGGWLCGKRVAINNLPARRLGYSSCSILMVIGGSTISQQGQKAREKTQLMIGPHHHSPHASFSPPPDVE